MISWIVTDDFPGGNIKIESITDDYVKLDVDNRDSNPWFYWAFKVCGAAGKTITFDFGKDAVGYFGPAVSHDLLAWHWCEQDSIRAQEEERYSFTYTFSNEENETYFAHNMLYNPEQFEKVDFVDKKTLCIDRKGTPVILASLGKGEKVILLTARHHACEAPASYVLEGVLREFYQELPKGYKVLAVPFVDTEGVKAGDQGKGRIPHDHNRDYIENSIYPAVRAIKDLIAEENVTYVFDFHDPMHIGGCADYIRLVNCYESMREDTNLFSGLLEAEMKQESTEKCLRFIDGKNVWREQPLLGTFSAYSGACEKVDYVTTIEMPYFGRTENRMTQESYIGTGRAFGRAIKKFIGYKV